MKAAKKIKKVTEKPIKNIIQIKSKEVSDEAPNALYLPKKDLFRIDEVAAYFSVTDRTIRLWIEHGHLAGEKVVGSIRISRDSILHCRFNKRVSFLN